MTKTEAKNDAINLFTWGEIIEVHTIGNVLVIEYVDMDKVVQFHSYSFNDERGIYIDTCDSFNSLDEAIINSIAYAHGNDRATEFIVKMLDM